MATTTIETFTIAKLEPIIRPTDCVEISAKLPVSVNYPFGTILGELTGSDSVQTLTPSTGANSITGGTYTLTWGGHTTSAISADADAADIAAAFGALTGVGASNIQVTGGPLIDSDVAIKFIGALGNAARTAITITTTSLTSGGTAAVTVTQTVTGAAGTPGTYKQYTAGNTDGSQNAKAILAYPCQTDASGNITFSDTSGQVTGDLLQTYPSCPVYISGFFSLADLLAANLDAGVLLQPGWTVKNGSVALGKGIVHLV